MKVVSRGKGQSAIAKAAYNSRDIIRDDQTGEMKDYARASGVEFSGIFAPKDAPEWTRDRAQLWNAVEQKENRRNSQLAKEMELAFPCGLTPQEREWLVKDFAREQFARKGLVADVNIHAPANDERNYHAHILFTIREVDAGGFAKHKREHTDNPQEWKEREARALHDRREKWAEMGAKALARKGLTVEAERWRHGHETLPEQRAAAIAREDWEYAASIDRPATKHRGANIDAMERRTGITSDRAKWREEHRELPSEVLGKALATVDLTELVELQGDLKTLMKLIQNDLVSGNLTKEQKDHLREVRSERWDEFKAVNHEVTQRGLRERQGERPAREIAATTAREGANVVLGADKAIGKVARTATGRGVDQGAGVIAGAAEKVIGGLAGAIADMIDPAPPPTPQQVQARVEAHEARLETDTREHGEEENRARSEAQERERREAEAREREEQRRRSERDR
jgi:hypothetical protein